MATTKKISKKNQVEEKKDSGKKLSKVGEWLNSGERIDGIIDMRAVLR